MKRAPALNSRSMLRYVLKGVALGALATVLVLVFTTGEETLQHLRNFPPALLPVLFGMVVVAWACNGARVWLMCRAAGHPMRYRQTIAVSLSTEFGIASTPAGVGGTVIRLTLLRQAGVPLTTAGSLLATDAAIDGIFFALLAPFAVYVLLRDGLLKRLFNEPSDIDALIGFGVLVACLAGFVLLLRSAWFHHLVMRFATGTQFGRNRRLAARWRQVRIGYRRSVRRILVSLGFLWKHRKGALFLNLLCASVQWCCRYMILPVIIHSLGRDVNPLPLFLVQGVLFAISLVVVVPGGGGSVEFLSAVILPGLVPAGTVGVVLIVWRFFTYHLYILGGGAMFFYTCQRMHRIFPRAMPTRFATAPVATQPPKDVRNSA